MTQKEENVKDIKGLCQNERVNTSPFTMEGEGEEGGGQGDQPPGDGLEPQVPDPPDPPSEDSNKDSETKKSRKPKRGPAPRYRPVGRIAPYHDSLYNEENRIGHMIRFNPQTHYKKFMTELEDLIHSRRKRDLCQEEVNGITSKIFRDFGLESPRAEEGAAYRYKLYTQAVCSFHEICRLLREPNASQNPSFDNLKASLEAVGCVVLHPVILKWISYNHGDLGFSPTLQTSSYTTGWTQERIDMISWPKDGSGVIVHLVKRDTVKYCFEEN